MSGDTHKVIGIAPEIWLLYKVAFELIMLGDEPTNPEQQNNADNDVDTPGLEMPEKEPKNYMFPTYPYTPVIVLLGGVRVAASLP